MHSSSGTAPTECPMRPFIFRCDYPRAIRGEWAVFWEVSDRESFFNMKCLPDDPTTVSTNWIAVDVDSVIELSSML